jgi:hypothetical protein
MEVKTRLYTFHSTTLLFRLFLKRLIVYDISALHDFESFSNFEPYELMGHTLKDD